MLAFAVLLPMVACVIPPSLSLKPDAAAPDSPPAIVAVRGEDGQALVSPGPLVFSRGSGSVDLTLVDTDVDDTLFVGFYVNYGHPDQTPARATCQGTPGDVERLASCNLAGLCETEDVGQTDYLTIVVFDRPLLPSGLPLFQAIAPDGLSTQVFFQLNCQQPTT